MSPATPADRPAPRLRAAADALVEAAWMAAVLLAPLYFNPRSARVFEPDKLAWLILLGIAAWLGLVLRASQDPEARRSLPATLRRPLPRAALLTGLAVCLGTLTSVAPTVSLWGAYRRGQGLIASLALLALFAAAAASGGRMALRTQLPRLASIAIVAASLYALLQRLGYDSLQWTIFGSGPSERAFGPLGNPIFLGAWLAMALPLALTGLMQARDARRLALPGADGRLLGHGLALLLGTGGLLATQSRGPLLGLAAGLVCFAMLDALRRGRRGLAVGAASAAGLGLLGLIGLARLGVPGLERLGQLLALGSRTARSRQLVWQAIGDLAGADLPRAVLGYGPESLAFVLPPHLSERIIQLSPEQYFDRAHNLLLDTWVSTGLPGLLALLLVFLAAFRLGFERLGLLAAASAGRRLTLAMLGGAGLGALLPALVGQPALGAPLAMAGLLAGALALPLLSREPVGGPAASEALPGTRPAARRGGRAAARAAGPANDPGSRAGREAAGTVTADAWLTLGLLAALAAHLVEAMVGLPTAAGDSLMWITLGLLAARPAADRSDVGARAGEPSEPSNSPLATGAIEGLALAAVLMAPLLLPSPTETLAAWPILLLLPAIWLMFELLASGQAGHRERNLARFGVAATFVLLLTGLGRRSGGEVLAFALTLAIALAIPTLIAWRHANAGPPPPTRRLAQRIGWAAPVGMLALSLAGGWWLALRPILADVAAREGQEALTNQDAVRARQRLEWAHDHWPEQPIFEALLASAYELEAGDPNHPAARRSAALDAAGAALERAHAASPDDYFAARLGMLLRRRGDQALTDADPAAAEAWWLRSRAYYAEALARHPLNPQTLLENAGLLERLGEVGGAADAYALAYRLNPALLEAAAGAIRMHLAGGSIAPADAILGQLLASGNSREAINGALQDRGGIVGKAPLGPAQVLLLARGGETEAAAQLLALLRERSTPPAEPALEALQRWLDALQAP